MRLRNTYAIIGVAVWATAVSAWANAVEVSLTPSAQLGKGLPSVNVEIIEPIAGFHLKLKRSDGERVDIKGGGKPGTTRVLKLAQPEGKFGYEGELIINMADGSTASMPLSFEASLLGTLKLKFEKSDLHLEERRLVFRANRPVTKVQLKVLMDTGEHAIDSTINVAPEPAGNPIEVQWPAAQGQVMQISVRAFDEHEYSNGFDLFPWFVQVPHDEVNFETARYEIRPEEQPKLDKCVTIIREAIAKYGKLAPLRLYIAGHTDTVGSTASNRTLSLNRARAIGAYFRKQGVSIPIFYEGFGEEALAVKTPDDTDEARNRRAEYIIAIEAPTVQNARFAPNWRRL